MTDVVALRGYCGIAGDILVTGLGCPVQNKVVLHVSDAHVKFYSLIVEFY